MNDLYRFYIFEFLVTKLKTRHGLPQLRNLFGISYFYPRSQSPLWERKTKAVFPFSIPPFSVFPSPFLIF
jgi:hypothetical protein